MSDGKKIYLVDVAEGRATFDEYLENRTDLSEEQKQRARESMGQSLRDVYCHCPDCIRCGCGLWEKHHEKVEDVTLPPF